MRIGPASKAYCVLLNRRVRQRRSKGRRHEADYNLELLEPLGASFERYPTRYVATDDETKGGAIRPGGEGDLDRQPGRDSPPGLGGVLGALAARAFHRARREGPDGRIRSRCDRRAGRELPGPLDQEETTSPPISP